MDALRKIPDGAHVIIDKSESMYVDDDVKELIKDFSEHLAIEKELDLKIIPPKSHKEKLGRKAVKRLVNTTSNGGGKGKGDGNLTYAK
jgi:hypothetical protein